MSLPKIFKNIDEKVKKTGDTMLGPLALTNGWGKIEANSTETLFMSRRVAKSDEYMRYLAIDPRETTAIKNAIKLVNKSQDSFSQYLLYGEHNKPDPPSINAMYSHATGWDFTKSHSSHQVSFDQSQAVGGPANEPWVNGLVSTHSNYLSSYIVNAHRSDNWYIGWSEHRDNTAVNPTWHKLLHDGNYNYFSPTLTGGGASGTWSISITGDAGTLNGHHSNEFLRCRGSASGSGPATKSNTLWNQIGIKEYFNALPDGLPDSGLYYYGACISFPGSNTRFDLYYNHHTSGDGDGLRYRTGWVDDKKDWAMIYDSKNITCGTGSASIYVEKGIYIKY